MMPIWLSTILEIIKVTVPALIVFFTVYYLLRTYLDRQYQTKVLEYKQKHHGTTLPLRLQAYERLALFLERIAIPNLVLRIQSDGMTASDLKYALLIAVQQEYEYNVTQQVYVSDQLWEIVKVTRDLTVEAISTLSQSVDGKAPSKDLVKALLNEGNLQQLVAIDKAISAVKKEAAMVM